MSAFPSTFATEGPGAGQVEEPRGIAINQESGEVFIADRNNNRVDSFASEGEFVRAWGFGVADGTNEEPQTCATLCFGGFGAPFEGSGTGQFSSAEGIAVDNDPLSVSHGDVYVLDAGNHRIQKFGSEGEFMLMFGGEVNSGTKGNVCVVGEECQVGVAESAPGFFQGLNGRSIAVDAEGAVYVGDENRVQRFSQGGVFEEVITLPGVGLIENLALDSSKHLFVAASELAGVHEYDESGKEISPVRDESGEKEHFAMAIGPGDELFVNDFREGSHHVFAYDSAGTQIASFDAGEEAQDGKRGIGSLESEALYVLNPGSVRIVAPPPPGPFILIGSETATEVQPTTATLGAIVNPEGPELTSYHFEYGTTTTYGSSSEERTLSGEPFEDQPASASLKGLEPSTTYHYQVVTTNGTQNTNGEDHIFTTLPPVSIDSTSVTEVNATSARLRTELNPHGLASEYHFEYGTTTAYGTITPTPDASTGSGTADITGTELIQGLTPSTTYHYRVVAHNSLGIVQGPDRSFTTQGPASVLADGRSWEMVSPPNKHGAPLESLTLEGGMIQSAAEGGAFAYVALGPPDAEPQGNRSPEDIQLLAKRGPEGWSTQNIATPHQDIAEAQVGSVSEYALFSEDLASALLEPAGATPLSPNTTERTPYRREANGEFVPLVTASNVLPGAKFGGEEVRQGGGQYRDGVRLLAATTDTSSVVLDSLEALTSGFSPEFKPAGRSSLYEWSAGRLQLVSVLPNGEPTAEAGYSAKVGSNNVNMRGAISSDGRRVVFEAGEGARERLYLRDLAVAQTVQLDEPQAGAAGGPGQPVFQGANDDGSKVFFTDASRLTSDSTAALTRPDLYMCEVRVSAGQLLCTLRDLSIDQNVGEAADVQGDVSAFDQAGSKLYFAANGVLTTEVNARGEHAVPGNCASPGDEPCNLYVYNTQARQIELVGVVSSRDAPDWNGHGRLRNLTARTSRDGHYFTFMSERSLTDYDNRDARSGEADEEVFLFDSQTGGLNCVSCNPSGARPDGAFDRNRFPGLLVDRPETWPDRWLAGSIPGWTSKDLVVSLYQSRYLSDSGRVFFNAADALTALDKNNLEDVYEFEPAGVGNCTTASASYAPSAAGCVNLMSAGTSSEESTFLDASESGNEVFFLTASRLLPSDVDTALDVYDAHVCGASSPCPPPPPSAPPACEGDSCQTPSSPPNSATPSSLTYKGPGNVSQSPPPVKAKATPTPAQLLARALKACKKKKPKHKRVVCKERALKKYGSKFSKEKKHAGHKKANNGPRKRGR